jgi:hypothetical protein
MDGLGLDDATLRKPANDFAREFKIRLPFDVEAHAGEANLLHFENGKAILTYSKKSFFFEELGYAFAHKDERADHAFVHAIPSLGLLLDCSRNAVMKPLEVERLLRYLAFLGYDFLELYTEDTFEVPEEPYFGHLRGRYSQDEIKKISAYAGLYGIELAPCIETLAHLGSLGRYHAFDGLYDINDIVLAESEKTYALLEEMIKSCADSFTSKRLNIGMDEAALLGRGRYYDIHGDKKAPEILLSHLLKVNEICRKYGFVPSLWSDMFVGAPGNESGLPFTPEQLAKIPSDITLLHWDYYHIDPSDYDRMIAKHKMLPDNPVSLATGAWKWAGYAPNNSFSFAVMGAGLASALKNGLKEALVTAWGDNGGECPVFSVLPSLFFAAEAREGVFEAAKLDALSFKAMAGLDLTHFLDLDLTNKIVKGSPAPNNYARAFLFNDPLLGVFDSVVPLEASEVFRKNAETLKADLPLAGRWIALFRTQADLNDLLSSKASFGSALRKDYQSGDKTALRSDLKRCHLIIEKLDVFAKTLEEQWDAENKPEGFDVQELRLGGLRARLISAQKKLKEYLSGKRESIPELMEPELPYFPGSEGPTPELYFDSSYRKIATGGVDQ